MNRIRKLTRLAVAFACLSVAPLSVAQACAVLADVIHARTMEVPREEIEKCIERGADPPLHLRQQSGRAVVQGDRAARLTMGLCSPGKGGCPISSQDHPTAPPGNPPGSNIPPMTELPWEEVKKAKLPCGAVANLSQMAIQSLWGNIRFEVNSPLIDVNVQNVFNTFMNTILTLIGTHTDCSAGTFWNIFNNVLNVVLPALGDRSFVYNAANSSFLSPLGTVIIISDMMPVSIDLSSMGAGFNLPNGGSFNDINGQQVTIAANDSVQFDTDGTVTTGSGETYQVNAEEIVQFFPNGAIGVPEGTWIPVDPGSKLVTMGQTVKPPSWVDM